MRDQTISYWLAVTPSESEHLEALLPASIFQPAPEKPARIVVPVRQRLAHRREVSHEKAFRRLGGVTRTVVPCARGHFLDFPRFCKTRYDEK